MPQIRHKAALPLAWIGGLLLLAGCSDQLPTGPRVGSALDPSAAEGVAVQAARPGYIRIGVVPSAASVEVGGNGDFVLRDKGTGAQLLTGSNEEVRVSLGSSATVRSNYRLQIACTGDPAPLVQRARDAGYVTHTEPVPAANCTRVFIGEFDPPPASTYSARVAFKNEAVAAGIAPADAFWKVVTIVEGTSSYQVIRGDDTLSTPNPVVAEATTGQVLIAGAPYRGIAEVATNSGGALAGINELPIEEYLYGVVPRELPPVPYGEVEAQKAQAVAARTYALSGLGKRRADGYDLLPTTSDQVYGGFAAEHPISTRAVDETRGVVATHGGALIQALFFSTSGGYTANNEDVFNSDPIPYLRGVRDKEQGNSGNVLDEIKNSKNKVNLRGNKGGDFEADWSRYHRWSFEWTADEISRVIGDFAGQPVGRVLAINVLERSSSNRVLRIEYVTENGTFYDTKDRIRSSLKYIDASGTPRGLLSTLFSIEPVTDNQTGEVTGFVAYGGGWGHGVGLCQTGAVGMAEKRSTYEEILKFYYQGIELETRQY